MPMPFPTAGPRPWRLVRGQSRLLNTLAGHGLAWRMVLPRCDRQVQRHRQALPVCRWTAASAGSKRTSWPASVSSGKSSTTGRLIFEREGPLGTNCRN